MKRNRLALDQGRFFNNVDTALTVLVTLLLLGFTLGFYKDLFGRWIGNEGLMRQTGKARERKRGLGKQIGDKVPLAPPGNATP